MATAVYLVSAKSFAGKSLLTLGLGKDAQRRVHYFKPVGPFPVTEGGVQTDKDALFVSQAFDQQTPLDALCPVLLTTDFRRRVLTGDVPDLLPAVRDAYTRTAEGADLVLVGGMGSLFSSGMAYGLPSWAVADALQAKALVISRYEPERSVDELLAAHHTLGERMLGGIFNGVRANQLEEVRSNVIPYLERQGIPIFGTLPDDPVLHAVPVSELVQELHATLPRGPNPNPFPKREGDLPALRADVSVRWLPSIGEGVSSSTAHSVSFSLHPPAGTMPQAASKISSSRSSQRCC